MAHKDICIKFEVDGCHYEAVGFLDEGESPIDGNTVLSRTAGKNGGAIGEKDYVFLSEHRSSFSEELKEYHLITGNHDPDAPSCVWFFVWDDTNGDWKLCRGLAYLPMPMGFENVLVLRCCP